MLKKVFSYHYAKEKGIEQLAPTIGKKKGQPGLEECVLDELNRIKRCPAGKRPMKSRFNHDQGKGYALFVRNLCEKCPHKVNCPVQKYGKHNYKWEYDAVKLRLRERRLYEQTPEFKSEYRMRGGIEALNGNLKQNTALRRLRCRGKTAVYNAIYTIAAMHNIMQYAAYCLKTGKIFVMEELAALFHLIWSRVAELFGFRPLNIEYFAADNGFSGQAGFIPGSTGFRKAGL